MIRRVGRVLALAVLAACDGAPPTSQRAAEADTAATADVPATRARYATTIAFAPTRGGTALVGHFVQSTDAKWLDRQYGIWSTADGGWQPRLRLRDTIPVPRAAWRVAPGDSLRLRIGDGARIVGLRVAGDPGMELLRGEEVTEWAGATGQRQSIALASLGGDPPQPGVLLVRRAARALTGAGWGQAERSFLLADTLGNTVLIEPDEVGGASARTFLHGAVEVWPDVQFAPADSVPSNEEGGAATISRWSIEIASAGLAGELVRRSPTLQDTIDGGVHVAYPIEAQIDVDGLPRLFRGVALELPLP